MIAIIGNHSVAYQVRHLFASRDEAADTIAGAPAAML